MKSKKWNTNNVAILTIPSSVSQSVRRSVEHVHVVAVVQRARCNVFVLTHNVCFICLFVCLFIPFSLPLSLCLCLLYLCGARRTQVRDSERERECVSESGKCGENECDMTGIRDERVYFVSDKIICLCTLHIGSVQCMHLHHHIHPYPHSHSHPHRRCRGWTTEKNDQTMGMGVTCVVFVDCARRETTKEVDGMSVVERMTGCVGW